MQNIPIGNPNLQRHNNYLNGNMISDYINQHQDGRHLMGYSANLPASTNDLLQQ